MPHLLFVCLLKFIPRLILESSYEVYISYVNVKGNSIVCFLHLIHKFWWIWSILKSSAVRIPWYSTLTTRDLFFFPFENRKIFSTNVYLLSSWKEMNIYFKGCSYELGVCCLQPMVCQYRSWTDVLIAVVCSLGCMFRNYYHSFCLLGLNHVKPWRWTRI